MILIGAAGRAGSGKDTVADYLVEHHGFTKFSFSDALYDECQTAFDLPDQSLLRNRDTKDTALWEFMLLRCKDKAFVEVALKALQQVPRYAGRSGEFLSLALSPRWVLQTWGTEYRRAQDPDYWIKCANEYMRAGLQHGVDKFINTSVRFANECTFIRNCKGILWHVLRPQLPGMDNAGHVSEKPLPIRAGDYVIENAGTIKDLGGRIEWTLDTMQRRAA